MKIRDYWLGGLAVLIIAALYYQPVLAQDARFQFVHASPDPAVAVVDIYLDDVIWQNDIVYGTATPFDDIPSGDRVFVIAPSSSTTSADGIRTINISLQSSENYHLILAGVLEPLLFPVNPEGRETTLNLHLRDGARDAALIPTSGFFDMRAFHAVFEWPRVRFSVKRPGMARVFHPDGASYGDFLDYFPGTAEDHLNGRIHLSSDLSNVLYKGIADLGNESEKALLAVYTGDSDNSEELIFRADGTRIFPYSVDTEDPIDDTPTSFHIVGNYPNPFNPVTTIEFDLPTAAHVRLDVFDLLGKNVLSVPEQLISAGMKRHLQVDASTLASGMYIYRISARSNSKTFAQSGRMTLLK